MVGKWDRQGNGRGGELGKGKRGRARQKDLRDSVVGEKQ